MLIAAAGMIVAVLVPGTAAILVAAVLLAGSVLASPLVFPQPIAAAQAQEVSARDGRPIVYWRPGSLACLQLRVLLLFRARRVLWVDIWRDPQGLAAVRALADGHDTVPTVVAKDDARVGLDPGWVREQLSGV
jgi:mycoredoxin